MEGFFSTREHTCQACAVLDRHAAEERDKGKPAPGHKVGVADDAWDEGYTPNPELLLQAIAQQH